MGLVELLALGAAVGVDTLSVSVGIGALGVSRRRFFELATAFTLTTPALFALGYLGALGLKWILYVLQRTIGLRSLGELSHEFLQDQATFALSLLSSAILLALGVQLAARQSGMGAVGRRRPIAVRGLWGLLCLAALVSVDAVAAGLSLGMLNAVQALHAVVVVGAVNGGMALFGLGLGRRLSRVVDARLRPLGGVILIGIALRLIFDLLD